jgi:hypothetical protein
VPDCAAAPIGETARTKETNPASGKTINRRT